MFSINCVKAAQKSIFVLSEETVLVPLFEAFISVSCRAARSQNQKVVNPKL